MRKAFTLIELLVVIAIIAILAAILFPVFAQAKLAAKKSKGLTQAKQIGTAMHIYLPDYDDVMFLYRTTEANPDYQECVAAGGADCNTVYGANARTRKYWSQLLYPYMKSKEILKSPGQASPWAGGDPTGANQEPPFRSYGGQNSYAVNQTIFEADNNNAMAHTSISDVANTLVLVDASYYNTLPRFDGDFRQFVGATNYTKPCTSVGATGYNNYWKNLGNSYLFRWNGAANTPSDAEAETLMNQRYSGQLVVIRADSSAKSIKSEAVMWDLRDKPTNSMWDPWKQGVVACP